MPPRYFKEKDSSKLSFSINMQNLHIFGFVLVYNIEKQYEGILYEYKWI